eukprot:608497_1
MSSLQLPFKKKSFSLRKKILCFLVLNMSASSKPRPDRKSKHKKKRLKNILSVHIREKKLRHAISVDSPKRKWKKLLHTPSNTSKLNRRASSKFTEFWHGRFGKRSSNTNSPPQSKKTHWRPSLHDICNDPPLLAVLTEFMERSYNEELILFLQSTRVLTRQTIDSDINSQIDIIFNRFISNSAKYQINLSFECFVNVTQMCQAERVKQYTLEEKQHIFKYAVQEVEVLMKCSVLPLFYISDEFRTIPHPEHIKIQSQSLPIIRNTLVAKNPPIALAMSHSASEHVEAKKDIDPMDQLVGSATDEMVFIGDMYFDSLYDV